MLNFDQFAGLPGIDSVVQTAEAVITFGPPEQQLVMPVPIDGAARDAGHTGQTNVLRPGLIMGVNTTTHLAKEWTSGATNGTQNVAGILLYAVNTQKDGADAPRWFGYLLVKGNVQAAQLIVPGATARGIDGNANEATLRTQFGTRILTDDFMWP